MTRTVGLTGGIACGKSTVAGLLRAQGVPVLDLDQVAREVVAPGEPALAEIAARWPQVVGAAGLDRAALGRVITADSEARRTLEAITHPRIWARMETWITAQTRTCVVEAALMVETGSYRRYDALLVVSCRPEIQLARLMARNGIGPAEAGAWLAAQMPVAEKEKVATVVIPNNGDLAALRAEVHRAWAAVDGAGAPLRT